MLSSYSIPTLFRYFFDGSHPYITLHFHEMFLLLVCMLSLAFVHHKRPVSVVCKGNEVNESWQCMCACATTEKVLCSRRRLGKGVLFVATRVCPRRVAVVGHVIKLKLTRRGNTLASMEKRLFLVYR